MFHRMTQSAGRGQRGEYACTTRLDIAFEALDLLLGPCLGLHGIRQRPGCFVARPFGINCRLATHGQRDSRWFAPRLEITELFGDFSCPSREHFRLMAIEFLLLLTTIDVEL